MLITVNEMSLTKPNEKESSIYLKKNKKDGESIREAALNEISDSDSDDYIHYKSSRKDSQDTEELEEIQSMNNYFNDKPMSLEEEERDDLQLMRERDESLESNYQADRSKSWKDVPSTSRDNSHSIPEADFVSQVLVNTIKE